MERPKCCGKEMSTAEEAGISPKIVFSDGFWAWTGKDIAFVCSVCGAQILKKDLEKEKLSKAR